VEVIVDRPLGTPHPRLGGEPYPVNYGYLPGTLSGDGHPIDAYLLGIDRPVPSATGIVIAVVLRADDNEDKLVVAPASLHYSAHEIAALVDFQERYFDSTIIVA
jgi:inorganic pyrophosphatase